VSKETSFLYRCSMPRCKNKVDRQSDFLKGIFYICEECAEREEDEDDMIFACQIYKRGIYGKTHVWMTESWLVTFTCMDCGYQNQIDDEPNNIRFCPRCGSDEINLGDEEESRGWW
jgi:predicted Zn-ribbon and HTH transcriptional regulator